MGSMTSSGRIVVGALIVAALVAGAFLAVVSRDVSAQAPGPPPGGGPGPGFQPGMPPFMGPPGGGAIAMMAFKDHIYIAQGGTLYKIDPESMTVRGEVQYLKPPGPPPPR